MKKPTSLLRKGHFLGTKLRNLRKRNNLTMEDLSVRCLQIDPEAAPSVSYLSMIENGKRVPSEKMLAVIAEIFQKDLAWFLDASEEESAIIDTKAQKGGLDSVALEPEFLFSKRHLQIAIPEMLSQTGTTGREFAHLLIRAHQEYNQNQFPDLERAAEEIGHRKMPLSADELFKMIDKVGLRYQWFDREPDAVMDENAGHSVKTFVRSFCEPDGMIYINKKMQKDPMRLKFDLATHIGHSVLYGKGGLTTLNATGQVLVDSANTRKDGKDVVQSMTIDSTDILQAWRNFESSFFASALLCPKAAFKQHLDRTAYSIVANDLPNVSKSVYMRRMTAVSPYPHWHYFDAYPPGNLKAVYRGNGIPLPWGNMRLVQDPCQHWAVFRMLASTSDEPSAQISVLYRGNEARIYCCESIRVFDLGGSKHVLCAGVDLNPAIEAQGRDAQAMAEEISEMCMRKGGSALLPYPIKRDLKSVAKVLNIGWIERGIEKEAIVICPRSSACPRKPACAGSDKCASPGSDAQRIRQLIIESVNKGR